MSRASQTNNPVPGDALLRCAVRQIQNHWKKQADGIMQFLEDSDAKKQVVNFAVEIDSSGADTMVGVKCRYSKAVTAASKGTVEDVNQGTFKILEEDDGSEEEAKPEPETVSETDTAVIATSQEAVPAKRGRGRPKKASAEVTD